MHGVSLFRLYLLRATYLLIAVGLGLTIWPLVLTTPADLEHMRGVARALLAGVSIVAVVGLRYPLQMLPLLFFEFVWKAVWMASVGLPRWLSGSLTPDIQASLFDCGLGLVIVPLVIPWGYVLSHYVRRPGDRWTGDAVAQPAGHNQGAS